MTDDETHEADRAKDAPHPRMTPALFGQMPAEQAFLDAYSSGKMPHAWLIHGPRGVGKATLAWRIARFMLTRSDSADDALFAPPEPPATLDADPRHPAFARISALGEPQLHLLRRNWDPEKKRFKTGIAVEDVRRMKSFFSLSATDGGWRVVIVDSADEMTPQAANALLKILEEPPRKSMLLLVSHQPAGLLPTIRSRCRALRCIPLGAEDQARALAGAGFAPPENPVALSQLSAGSTGNALRLLQHDGLAVYARLVELLGQSPGLDRGLALALAEGCAGRDKAERFDLTLQLLSLLLTRLARFAVLQSAVWEEAAPHEARSFARLAPGPAAAHHWAELAAQMSARTSHARAVNIDPASVILDALLSIDGAARKAA